MQTSASTDRTCFTAKSRGGRGALEINKFEQVSSNGRLMSVAEGGDVPQVTCPQGEGTGHEVPRLELKGGPE